MTMHSCGVFAQLQPGVGAKFLLLVDHPSRSRAGKAFTDEIGKQEISLLKLPTHCSSYLNYELPFAGHFDERVPETCVSLAITLTRQERNLLWISASLS